MDEELRAITEEYLLALKSKDEKRKKKARKRATVAWYKELIKKGGQHA